MMCRVAVFYKRNNKNMFDVFIPISDIPREIDAIYFFILLKTLFYYLQSFLFKSTYFASLFYLGK